MDPIDAANAETVEQFVLDYLPLSDSWTKWVHPATQESYSLTLHKSTALSTADLEACFRLIESTSSDDYKKSKQGWMPRSKRKEMKLFDLKYLLVKKDNQVEGFLSFMPTYEDDFPVIYCYEIHLSPPLQGTGLGTLLMNHVDTIASQIPSVVKTMLTCFTRNSKAVAFYTRLGYTKDVYSPEPKLLRKGTIIESEYIILSKPRS